MKAAQPHTAQKGFTLVELLVSVAIFTVITTVAVFNQSQFNSSVLLTNLAYEIALSVRQAQFYGITVKQSSVDSTKFDSGYGVHFDINASKTSYTLFEDRAPKDHVYQSGEALETYNIQKGNTISKICLDSDCSKTKADISFIRPNPDTYITSGGIAGIYYSTAVLCVSSPQNVKRKVLVESTGQISVQLDTTALCN